MEITVILQRLYGTSSMFCFPFIVNMKQKNVKDGLLKEVRKREHYSKPGERRREAKKEGIKNSRRRERNYN